MNWNTPNFPLENWDLRLGISWNSFLETRFDYLIFWQYFPFSSEDNITETINSNFQGFDVLVQKQFDILWMSNFFFKFPTENSEGNEELAEEQDEDFSGKNYNLKMYLHYW